MRGNARTQGEERRKEGGGIFGEGSRTPVAITILVKDPDHTGPCELRYHDIGDYLKREEKLDRIQAFGGIEGIEQWQTIAPDAEGDWINQRDPAFAHFLPLGDKKTEAAQAIFEIYSRGLVSDRDAWVYNFSSTAITDNMKRMIDTYNTEVDRYKGTLKNRYFRHPADSNPLIIQAPNLRKLYFSRCPLLVRKDRERKQAKR